MPFELHLAQWTVCRLGFGEQRPNRRQVFRAELRFGRESAQFLRGLFAALILPGRAEVIGQIDGVAIVGIHNPPDAILVARGIGPGPGGCWADASAGLSWGWSRSWTTAK